MCPTVRVQSSAFVSGGIVTSYLSDVEVAHGAARRRAGGLPAAGGGGGALPLDGVRPGETHDGGGGSDVSISLKADTKLIVEVSSYCT